MKIEKNISAPSVESGDSFFRSGTFGIFNKMVPGDSVLFDDPKTANRHRSAFRQWCHRNGRKGIARKTEAGVRIWLVG